jgi:hypothetical protein
MPVRQTSIDIYKELKRRGILSEIDKEFCECLIQNGPMTAKEIFRTLGCDTNRSGTLTRLREARAVYEVRKRPCRVTGNTVIEWDLVSTLPENNMSEKKTLRRLPSKRAVDAIDYITAATKWFALEGEEQLPPDVKRFLEWLKEDNEKRLAKSKQ